MPPPRAPHTSDGYLPDPGLAHQPVHADPLHAPVRDGHGDGPAAGHHQPPGRVVAEGGFRPGERAGVGESGRGERRRGIDHGIGRVFARRERLPDRRPGRRGPGFRQPAVPVQQQRPVVHRGLAVRPGRAGRLSEDGEDDLHAPGPGRGRPVAASEDQQAAQQGRTIRFHRV